MLYMQPMKSEYNRLPAATVHTGAYKLYIGEVGIVAHEACMNMYLMGK